MAEGDDRNMFYTVFRALGSLDAEVRGKAGRDELQKLHSEVVRMDGEVEQRSRDLIAASVEGVKRDMRGLEESVRKNGQGVEALHGDMRGVKATLSAIRETVEAQAQKKNINWFDIIARAVSFLVMLAVLIGTAIAIFKGTYNGVSGFPKF